MANGRGLCLPSEAILVPFPMVPSCILKTSNRGMTTLWPPSASSQLLFFHHIFQILPRSSPPLRELILLWHVKWNGCQVVKVHSAFRIMFKIWCRNIMRSLFEWLYHWDAIYKIEGVQTNKIKEEKGICAIWSHNLETGY